MSDEIYNMSKEISDYYLLSPIDFQILKSIEIKPLEPYFNKLSIYIILSNRDHTKTLHLYFEDVHEFFFNQPERSSIHFMLSIREKNELGLYRVLCEEQDTIDVIGFYCSFFTATIV